MGARRTLGKLARGTRDALRAEPGSEAFRATEAQALRDELLGRIEQTASELEELRAVVGALQEQLDRWAEGSTAAIDAMAERLATLERALEQRTPAR